ncbi:MAG TPA: hypothetical protein VIX83_00060 [Candidatus Cybelea sp.]
MRAGGELSALQRIPRRSDANAEPDADAVPHSPSTLDAGAVLARWGFKPISVVNLIIAATALVFSLYNTHEANAREHKRLVFGGAMLGQNYEHLVLCEQRNAYAQCQQAVSNADFKKLDPILDAVLNMPVDWPLDSQSKPGGTDRAADPFISGDIVLTALYTDSDDKSLGDAFLVGEGITQLLALDDDPQIATDATKRAAFRGLAQKENQILSERFGGTCNGEVNPDSPNHSDVSKLFGCINGSWLP